MPQPSFSISRRVEFRDTDAAGIVHFSVFFTYMEEAEHEFLRSLGLNILLNDAEGQLSFPRVSASCDYHSPLRFEDNVEMTIRLCHVGKSSISYEIEFATAGRTAANGKITAVCCRILPDGAIRPISIPDWIREKLPQA